ncbi:hypothetical protein FPRO04_14393 [Fusarium proliferatum]|nr:hypothetical protein FPRO04_14393 [Fusarium proliferatum]
MPSMSAVPDSPQQFCVPQSPSRKSEPTPYTTSVDTLDYASTNGLGLIDLRLLHHWTIATSIGVSKWPKDRWIWQTVLPQIGFRYSFVLHAMLGLAALHIAYQDGVEGNSMWTAGIFHHSQALSGFQQEIAHITEENSEALFMWSVCNILYTFAMSNPLRQAPDLVAPSTKSTQYDKTLGAEWIPMIRGVNAVLVPTHNFIRLGRMKAMMSLGNWYELDPDKDNPCPEDVYFCGVREIWKASDSSQIYEEVLRVIRRCRLYSQQFCKMDAETLEQWGHNKEWSAPFILINMVPEAYFPLLQQRQPPALVLFSYFGAMLHKLDHYWFLEGWGKAIVETVADILGSYWEPWISWPLQVIQGSA